MVKVLGQVEGYGGDVMVRLVLLNQFELQMFGLRPSGSVIRIRHADFPSITVVIDVFGDEHRGLVSRTERLELLEQTEEFRGDLVEVQVGVNCDNRGEVDV